MNSRILIGLSIVAVVLVSGCVEPSDIEYCEQDSDCTLAIHIDTCCGCPFITTKKRVEHDSNLVAYEHGKDYSSLLPGCREVDCAPCVGAPYAVCSNNTCQEPRTWEEILRVCPDCYTSAATAAYREGDFEKAIKTCANDTSKDFFGTENKENCILSLARITLDEKSVDETIEICLNYLEKLQGACLREVAQEIAKTDIERGLRVCENITDAPSLGYSPKNNCFHNIAVTARKTNESRALEICEMMSERVEECKDLIKNYCTKYPC